MLSVPQEFLGQSNELRYEELSVAAGAHSVLHSRALQRLNTSTQFLHASSHDARTQTPPLGVCPPSEGATIAAGVPNGKAVTFDHTAHLAPVEDPERTATELRNFFLA